MKPITLLLFVFLAASPCGAQSTTSEELRSIADEYETQSSEWTQELERLKTQTEEALNSSKMSGAALIRLEEALQTERKITQAELERRRTLLNRWKTGCVITGALSILLSGALTAALLAN